MALSRIPCQLEISTLRTLAAPARTRAASTLAGSSLQPIQLTSSRTRPDASSSRLPPTSSSRPGPTLSSSSSKRAFPSAANPLVSSRGGASATPHTSSRQAYSTDLPPETDNIFDDSAVAREWVFPPEKQAMLRQAAKSWARSPGSTKPPRTTWQGRGAVPRKKAQLKPVAMAPVYPISVLRNKPADVFAGVRGKIVSHDKMYKKSFEDRPTANLRVDTYKILDSSSGEPLEIELQQNRLACVPMIGDQVTFKGLKVEHSNSKNPDKPSTVRLVQPTAREWSWSHVLSKDPPVYSTADELHERKTEPRRVNVRGILGGSVDFGVHSGKSNAFRVTVEIDGEQIPVVVFRESPTKESKDAYRKLPEGWQIGREIALHNLANRSDPKWNLRGQLIEKQEGEPDDGQWWFR